jgi:hypothetical protein
MTLLLTLCLLSAPAYETRQDAIHALKISPATFKQLAGIYRGIPPEKFPEMSVNLRDVLWQKWYNEKLNHYFEADTYYYDSERRRLEETMKEDFKREL